MTEWISVKERLPEIWVKVLSFQPTFDEDCCGMIRSAVYIGNGKWRETEHHEMMELPVTHWMPLPEPPKEGGEDEMIISELHLEEEPKPHKCSCGATPRFIYNGLLWVVECPKCFNSESGWTALSTINAWNRRVDKEGGSENGI